MKRRILSLMLVLAMVLALLPMTTFAAAPSIQNVRISEGGILTWDALPGTEKYSVLVGNGGGNMTETYFDLFKACADFGFENGDYTVKLYARDSAKNIISETWTGTFHYVSTTKKLATPTNLRFEGMTCKWNAVPHATLYIVSLLDETGRRIEDGRLTSNTEYTFTLEIGKSYKFKVYATAPGFLPSEVTSNLYTFNGIEISTIPITAEWSSDCTRISSYSTTAQGCRITKVEMAKNGVAITKATPGDTINVAFTVELNPGYLFSSSCHAYWNGTQETARIVGSADNVKRFAFKLTVPTPSITAVSITDIDKPVIGQHPDLTFRIVNANDLGLTGSVTWYEYKNGLGGAMSSTAVFREGYTYGCSISIAAMNGIFRYTTEVDDYGDEYDVFDGSLTVNGDAVTGYVSMNATRLSTRWWSGAALPNMPFVDVKVGDFFFDPVVWAVSKGITNGVDATHFGPSNDCLRAQVVTFLWRAAGQPEPKTTNNPFVDVKSSDFYYKPVLWAVEKGITSGMDATHFGPMEKCNRAQVVTFLYRAAGSPSVSGSNPFVDVPKGSFYEAPVLWAVSKGITNGMDATHFGPTTICNRAQIVTFLYRAYK